MLKFTDVGYSYHTINGQTPVLKNFNLSVEDGQFVAVVGPSGCGKSTILSLAARLIKPSQGQIDTNGAECGYMLQRDALFEWRTVERNIFLPLEIKKKLSKESKERVLKLVEKYGLKDFLKKTPNELSGGMRQRVALIRTIALGADILLLDEPFSALDYQTRLKVCDDVHSIIKGEGKTALLVTHDISEAIALSDKVVVLSARPASVIKEHKIDFGDGSPKSRRESSAFSSTFEIIRKELGI